MRLRQLLEGQGFTYTFADAFPMVQSWLAKFAKSEDVHDFNVFRSWVLRLRDDPRLKGVGIAKYEIDVDRDIIKMLRGRLNLIAGSMQAQRWQQARSDYSWLLAMVYRLQQELPRWTAKPEGRPIILQMLDNDVLGIRWADKTNPHWVEVRGTNYWKWNSRDPLHRLIDKITGNISDLMIGREVVIDPRYTEYNTLKRLLKNQRYK